MQDKVGVDPKVLNDVELIAFVRETQEEIEAHGELNELNSFLRDFATELVKRRVLAKVQFVRFIELNRPE
jgi:hypothetical protein